MPMVGSVIISDAAFGVSGHSVGSVFLAVLERREKRERAEERLHKPTSSLTLTTSNSKQSNPATTIE